MLHSSDQNDSKLFKVSNTPNDRDCKSHPCQRNSRNQLY